MFRPEYYDTDPRVRRYCVPVKVIKTFSDVAGSENLLIKRPSQIPLATPEGWESCVLKGSGAAVLVDFGCEFHGSARIYVQYVKSPSSRADLRIRFGESATEAVTPVGQRGATNDHANRDMILNVGSWSANETNATGYRFLYVELTEEAEVALYMLQGVSIFRDMPQLGSFRCDDDRINDIYDTAVYTAALCAQEYLWDGIKRDRLIWCGDMYPSALTLTAVYGDVPVLRQSMDMQKRITPADKWMNGMSAYTLWWILTHELIYLCGGDEAYLRDQADYIRTVCENVAKYIDEDGSEHLPGAFLDWPNSQNPAAIHAGQQALLVRAMKAAAGIFDVCGRRDDADFCRALAAKAAGAKVDPNGSKQAAALMALWGLSDPKTTDEQVLTPGGAKGYSTFLGYGTLAAKAEAGNMTGALRDMKAYWGRMLELGATTFWEDFDLDWTENACRLDELPPEGANDIHADHGSYCYTGLRHSFCHAWASGPAPFLAHYVLGIRPLARGFEKCLIAPSLGFLNRVEGTCPTPRGNIHVIAEKRADGTVKVTAEAPEGIELIYR